MKTTKLDGNIGLTIRDDGVGLLEDLDWKNTGTLPSVSHSSGDWREIN
ncbi:hypothetical protein KKI24_27055 [bacterium]|nr:hypothetical protein [bacterium]